jgi:hypothetical protein
LEWGKVKRAFDRARGHIFLPLFLFFLYSSVVFVYATAEYLNHPGGNVLFNPSPKNALELSL